MECNYVPILKWKQGEKNALYYLSDSVKDRIVPLIEIVSFNNKNNKKQKNYWDNRPFYLYINNELHGNNLKKFNKIKNEYNNNYTIPVITNKNTDEIINNFIYTSNNGFAIRINKLEFKEIDNIIYRVNNLDYNMEIDLILDLFNISSADLDVENIFYLSNIINKLYDSIKFRRIIIASTAIPNSMSEYEKHKIIQIERYEIKLFEKLSKKVYPKLVFSDYCTKYYKYMEYNHFVHKYFNIKYTTNDYYLLVKGELDKKGFEKENISFLCKLLTLDSRYCGENYSFGDKYIYDRSGSDLSLGYGNATTWITNCINHHITFTSNNI